jgi:DTW domain-containing protein
MGSRRESRDKRCMRCQVTKDLCFCEHIPTLATETKVVVIMHFREQWLTSNTAILAKNSLTNSDIQIRGERNSKVELNFSTEDYQPLLLFPSENSQDLTEEFVKSFDKPIALIVPDGSWTQAKKIPRREPCLKDIPHVKIPFTSKSKYLLRTAPNETYLSTFEAIAKAIGIIESKDVETELEKVFDVMVRQNLKSRAMEYKLL